MLDLTPVLEAVIALAAAIITVMVIPFIKSKISTEKQSQLRDWVWIGVGAAEQIYKGKGLGIQKKQYVEDFLLSKGIHIDYDTISAMIESTVNNMFRHQQVVSEDEPP